MNIGIPEVILVLVTLSLSDGLAAVPAVLRD